MSSHTASAATHLATAASMTLAAVTAVAIVVTAAMALYLPRLRRQRDQARWQANHDPLTGAPNRRALATALTGMLANHDPVAAVIIDLDRFKTINDLYGYRAGDQVLVETAGRLARLPPPVVLTARLGGDEFVLLATGGPDQALAAAYAAWAAIAAAPVPIEDGHSVQVFASIGVAAGHPRTGLTAAQLLHHADLAMHQAKTRGGGVRAHTPHRPTDRPTHRRRDLPRH